MCPVNQSQHKILGEYCVTILTRKCIGVMPYLEGGCEGGNPVTYGGITSPGVVPD